MLQLLTLRPILAAAKKPEPPKLKTWTVYKVAGKFIQLGTVEAPNKRSAIERGAKEFKVDAWRLSRTPALQVTRPKDRGRARPPVGAALG